MVVRVSQERRRRGCPEKGEVEAVGGGGSRHLLWCVAPLFRSAATVRTIAPAAWSISLRRHAAHGKRNVPRAYATARHRLEHRREDTVRVVGRSCRGGHVVVARRGARRIQPMEPDVQVFGRLGGVAVMADVTGLGPRCPKPVAHGPRLAYAPRCSVTAAAAPRATIPRRFSVDARHRSCPAPCMNLPTRTPAGRTAPPPLGANLCPARRRVCPEASGRTGTLPTVCAASVCTRRRARGQPGDLGDRLMVPTSLFACMMETRTVSGRNAGDGVGLFRRPPAGW